MAIICDVCGDDVTPGKAPFDDEEANDLYSIIKLNGVKVCACLDCYMAISDWIQSTECKEYCNKHKA